MRVHLKERGSVHECVIGAPMGRSGSCHDNHHALDGVTQPLCAMGKTSEVFHRRRPP